MEKVIIKTCVKKETKKGTFYTIELSDGRKGISSEDLTSKMGQEAELDVKEGKPYEGVMQYYFNLPKSEKPAGKFPAKDWTFEKRRAALENAVNFCRDRKELTSANSIDLANKYLEFLNTK
jgi:hypothetical protein